MPEAPLAPAIGRYTLPARVLHGLGAAAILTAVALALSFDDLPLSPQKIRLINYHKWAGLTALWLVLLRLAWRIGHAPPPVPATIGTRERRIAQGAHAAIYLLMLVTPLIGWWLSTAKGFSLRYFGVIPLPDIGHKDRALAEQLQPVHMTAAWTLVGLAGLHIAAALKHQWFDRIPFLRRMV
jgi:cytochrome b561